MDTGTWNTADYFECIKLRHFGSIGAVTDDHGGFRDNKLLL